MKKIFIIVIMLLVTFSIYLSASSIGSNGAFLISSAAASSRKTSSMVASSSGTVLSTAPDIDSKSTGKSDIEVPTYTPPPEKYTQQQLDEAETALQPIMDTLYLDDKSPVYIALRDGTAPADYMKIAFSEFKPDINTIIPIYIADMFDWLKTGDLKITPRFVKDELQTYTCLTLDIKSGQLYGYKNIYTNGIKWINGGHGLIQSPYETTDFYIHRVKILELLRSTNLSLEKTSTKALCFNGVGAGYYLTDGTQEYFLLISPNEDSPMLTEDSVVSFTDAAENMQIIRIEDLKPLVEKQVALIEKYRELYGEEAALTTGGGGIIAFGKQKEAEKAAAFKEKLTIIIPSCLAGVAVIAGAAVLIRKKRHSTVAKK